MHADERTELRRQLGVENPSWAEAGRLSMILYKLNRADLHSDNYKYINRYLLEILFDKHEGIIEDPKRRTLWAVNMVSDTNAPLGESMLMV